MLTAALLTLMLQVGPNPTASPISAVPPELQEQRERQRQSVVSEMPLPDRLTGCIERADEDAAAATLEAQSWLGRARGVEKAQALHCLGYSQAKLARWSDSSQSFLSARDALPESEPQYRARLGAIAGNTLLTGGDFRQALSVLDLAKADATASGFPALNGEVELDRARALLELGEVALATEALAGARKLTPRNSRAWLLSAVLARRNDNLGSAQTFITQADKLNSYNPEIMLEAGVIAVLSGNDGVANDYWERIVAIAPDSPEFATAQSYLRQLDTQ